MHKNILGYFRSRYRKNPFPWIYLLISLVAAVTVGSMGYIFHLGNSMVARYAPHIQATMQIELRATTGHLWFEEIMNGDRHENIDDTLKQIDRADLYAQAILEGGEIEQGEFVPLKEKHLRQEIITIREKLAEFRDITLQRWQTSKTAGAGTYIDQKYDEIFKNFVEQADHVKGELQQRMRLGLKRFRTVQILLIAICLFVTAVVGIAFGRFVSRSIRDECKLRDLISELTITEDRERKNIAGLLHDDFMQRLAMSKMKLGQLSEILTLDNQLKYLEDIRNQINSMLSGMRSLTLDLCPAVLYDIGLEAALRDWIYKEVIDGQEPAVNFQTIGHPLHLDEDLRIVLYRATREIMMNVVKHAHAKNVSILIENLTDMIKIEIIDDGVGFQITGTVRSKTFSEGLGLFLVCERIEHFGGSLEIESKPNTGSKATMTVPVGRRNKRVKEKA